MNYPHPHPLLSDAAAAAELLLGWGRVRVYLLTPAEAGERFNCSDRCVAFWGPILDLSLAPLLKRMGRWHGRGFAAIVDVDRLQRCPGDLLLNVLGATIHEAAHFLEVEPADWRAAAPGLVAEVVAMSETLDYSHHAKALSAPAWHQHGWRFIRAAAHLTARYRRLDERLTPEHVRFAGDFYGLSPAREYMKTLETELRDCRRMPIRVALATPPPQPYLELWKRDTENSQHAN